MSVITTQDFIQDPSSLRLPSPLQLLESPLLASKNVRVYVKREDLIHSIVSGNKWRKLKYNIRTIQNDSSVTLLSFGGAYSNHIYALAGAGKMFGFSTIGIIRGEAHHPLNPTLAFAKKSGMLIHYVSRKDYRLKETPEFVEELRAKFGDFILIPEGGSNKLALPGCAEIITELDQQLDDQYHYVCVACGTGGTLAGLASSTTEKNLLGFSVLKGGAFLRENVARLLGGEGENDNWRINLDYHFDGYAKKTIELMNFIKNFEQAFKIRIEPVYTGKMFYGLFDLIENNYFPKGSIVVALHTGGMQNEIIQ